jgi:hypothetical protein
MIGVQEKPNTLANRRRKSIAYLKREISKNWVIKRKTSPVWCRLTKKLSKEKD